MMFHVRGDGRHRIGGGDGIVFVLVCLDKGGQDIEAFAIGRACFGLVLEVFGDLRESPVVVVFGPDGANVLHHTFSGSILSYSLCVPTNLIRTLWNLYATWTINRYLLPPMSKM